MDQLRQGELRAAFEQFKYAEAWSAKWAKSAKEIWDVYQQKLGDIYMYICIYIHMYIIYIYINIYYNMISYDMILIYIYAPAKKNLLFFYDFYW